PQTLLWLLPLAAPASPSARTTATAAAAAAAIAAPSHGSFASFVSDAVFSCAVWVLEFPAGVLPSAFSGASVFPNFRTVGVSAASAFTHRAGSEPSMERDLRG
ncbi:hypothetical protein V8G54_006176, partial [Vigna mungo]